jgi:fatty-acyl-CoA synthase
METLGAFLDAAAARAPEREALAWAERDTVSERRTWAALRDASRHAARKLLAIGVGKGTRVGLLCPNRPEWLPIAFGALRLGAILVPFSTLWKREEIAYGLRHGDVQLLLARAGFLKHDYLADLTALVPALDDTAPGRLHVPEFPAQRRVILLAPGTTARRHARCRALGRARTRRRRAVSSTPLERTVSPTDARHGLLPRRGRRRRRRRSCTRMARSRYPAGASLTPRHHPTTPGGATCRSSERRLHPGRARRRSLAAGRLVLQEQASRRRERSALLEAERCTITALLAPGRSAARASGLRAGAWHRAGARTTCSPIGLAGPDHVAVGMYGMSETATCVACARWDDPPSVRRETFGRPLEGMDVRIVDPETRRPVAPGEQGEIIVKGPTLMEGYYRVPPSETFDPEGYFHTGDLGWLDADGCLHFAGRLKDVIKTAGVNVAAAEVEEALARHPTVKAAHVVGVPHPTRGENVAAFVVPRAGEAPDPAALAEFVRSSLASYKAPRHVFVIDESAVPRTATGKIEKPALRREAERRLQE